MTANNLIEEIVFLILHFRCLPNISFCFAMILFLREQIFCLQEHPSKSIVRTLVVKIKCLYTLHLSCSGIVVKTFENSG